MYTSAELINLTNVIECIAVRLDAPSCLVSRAQRLLSPKELKQSRAFRFAPLSRRYIVAHGCLRELIGNYLQISPNDVRFHFNKWGKPSIEGTHLQFNMCHSGDMAVYAFTADSSVGVDVERIRPVRDMGSIAEQLFTAAELAKLSETKSSHRDEAFLRIWTRKESYIKALGLSLSYLWMQSRVVSRQINPGLISVGDSSAAMGMATYDINPATGYVGAIAVCNPFQKTRRLLRCASSTILARNLPVRRVTSKWDIRGAGTD